MRNATTALRILLLAALAVPTGAEAEAPRRSARTGVPAAIVREVSARATERGVSASEALVPVAEAAERGVPAELVAAKVLEGISKGVPPARIAAVARGLTDRLARADLLLRDAQRAGLAPVTDRNAALGDLGTALAAGIGRPHLDALLAAARSPRGGRADAVVSAAHVLGELVRRDVSASDAMPLGLAIARHGPSPGGEIPALFDAWRAEGGKDVHAFLDEAARRLDSGRKLDGMVDPFGLSPEHLVNDKAAGKDRDREGLAGSDVGKHGADQGLTPGERPDKAHPATPGLEVAAEKRKGKK